MLIQPDKNELGDLRLDPKEGLAKIKEENIRLRAKDKIAGQAQLEDQMAALGNPMGYAELIRKLKKLNPALVIQDGGYPNAVAVRIYRDNGDGEGTRLTYLTGFLKEVLPEFSSVTTDDHGVADKEKRGWRSVILMLLKQGVLNYADTVRVFGDANGQRSNRWHQQLQTKELK